MFHNVLPTRATFYRDGISESPLSNLCNAEEQTLHHLLINCTLILDFWTLFQDWWHQKTNEKITLSTSHTLWLAWWDKALANPKLLSTHSQISHFLHKPSRRHLRFSNLLLFITRKLEILRDRDCKKRLPKFYRTWAIFL